MERQNDFRPVKVLQVYQSGNNYYIEIHDVYLNTVNTKQEYAMTSGRPLDKKTLRKLLGVSSEKDYTEKIWEKPLIDSGILAFRHEKYSRYILWWRPRKAVHIIFRDDKKVKPGIYKMPAMLFFANLDKLKIFALKENSRPALNTKLYMAPLYNATAGNEMCWGNVYHETEEIIEIDKEMTIWEDALWKSVFTHPGVTVSKNNLSDIYKKMAKTNGQFPSNELIDSKITINDLIKDL